jgi:glycosyltransferase involved in cell wall biosynthesis
MTPAGETMRRAIIVNYHVPPIGGAGALRGVKLVRGLPALGYEPIVVTGPGGSHGRWRPEDQRLADESPGAEIHRIVEPEPERATGWAGRRERWLARPTAWDRWWIEDVVETGRRAAAERPVDLVYADLGPDATAEAAIRLARALGVPCIVDLQDPWALDEMRVQPTVLHRRVDHSRMGRALRRADVVVMNTTEARAAVLAAFPALDPDRVHAIPYGYDAGDFEAPEPAVPDDGVFRIVHTGSFHTHLGRRLRETGRLRRLLGGGADLPVDIITRSPVYLVQALDRLLAARPELAQRIELHVAGLMLDDDREVLDRCPVVRMHGFQTHDESVRLMRSADVLFLPMQDLPAPVRARAVPCKTYEYLASGRPVLAAVPDGDARDLLERAEDVFPVRPSDVEGMARVLERELDRGARRPSVSASRAELLRPLDREQLNRDLAAVFDATLNAPPAPAGAPSGAGLVAQGVRS